MATCGVGDTEYDSDPEEAKRSLVMRRRRAASDDENSEDERGTEREREGPGGVANIQSDESDAQGGVADYDDEVEEYSEEEEEEETYNDEEELVDGEEVHGQDIAIEDVTNRVNETKIAVAGVSEGAAEEFADAPLDGHINQEGEKKVKEPYAVPTAGAFYMHDDRFRDNAGGRHRY